MGYTFTFLKHTKYLKSMRAVFMAETLSRVYLYGYGGHRKGEGCLKRKFG